MAQNIPVRVRFCPSPTGFLHVGVARTAVFNYLYARKHGGAFVLRIEDTDQERSKREFEEDIINGLSWLGITPDEDVVRQSERTDVYTKYLEQLIESGHAYEAEANEAGTGSVIRFKNSNESVTFTDVVRGDITFDTTDLGDFVIAKDRKTPLYQLAVVVDDHEMGITHIIRGEDLISSTPRQLLIMRAIGAHLRPSSGSASSDKQGFGGQATEPLYAHLPLILGEDRSKLSKRHGAVSLSTYKDAGYLSDAFINFLALLGWSPGDDREVFSREELIRAFSLEHIQKGGAIFNTDKLNWINKEHIKLLPETDIRQEVGRMLHKHYNEAAVTEKIDMLVPIILERIHKWGDIDDMAANGELHFFFEKPEYEREHLNWKDTDTERTKTHLARVLEILNNTEFSSSQDIKNAVWEYANKEGRGEVLWPLRYALSGRDKSPDPFTLSFVLGKDETLARIQTALDKLA